MGGGVRPGGCERCGREEPVVYTGWQFLCADCRVELSREKAQEAQRAQLMAQVESAKARQPGRASP